MKLGGKRLGKEKAWEKDGRIGSTSEPSVEQYFKHSFDFIGKTGHGMSRKPEPSRGIHLNLADGNVLDACLRILRHLDVDRLNLKHEEDVLTHISKATGMKLKTVRKRIVEMSGERLVKKTYSDGGMRLTLTDEGRDLLENPQEWMTKKREERNAQDQPMIEDLKRFFVELRMGAEIESLLLPLAHWLNMQILGKDNVQAILETSALLRTEMPKLIHDQPHCSNYPPSEYRKYDVDLEEYRKRLEDLRSRVDVKWAEALNDLTFIRKHLDEDIEQVTRFCVVHKRVLSTQGFSSLRKDIEKLRFHLHFQKIGLEELESTFSDSQFQELEKLGEELKDYAKQLDYLSKDTHVKEPSEWQEVIVDPGRQRRAEGSGNDKPARIKMVPTHLKCTRCGREWTVKRDTAR